MITILTPTLYYFNPSNTKTIFNFVISNIFSLYDDFFGKPEKLSEILKPCIVYVQYKYNIDWYQFSCFMYIITLKKTQDTFGGKLGKVLIFYFCFVVVGFCLFFCYNNTSKEQHRHRYSFWSSEFSTMKEVVDGVLFNATQIT